jgi:two-component system, NarL family, sensor kinase
MSTRLLLIALAGIFPAQILLFCGNGDILSLGLATSLALIIVWLGYKQFILKPLNALVKASQQVAGGASQMQVEPPLKIAEFAQLVTAFNETTMAVRHRSSRRRKSEQRYQELVESLPEGLLVQIADRIVLANVAAFNLLHVTAPAQLLGKFMLEFVHPDSREVFTQRIAQLKANVDLPPVEGKFLRLDGTAVDVEVKTSVLDHHDEPAVQFIARDITFRKQAEQQLRELSLRLLKAQDEERRRLARDLHDSTTQELAALMTRLGIVEEALGGADQQIRQHCAECRELADHCLKQIRATSYLLHPPLLDEMGLTTALKHHVKGFEKRSNIQVTLDLPPNVGRLPQEAELTLFRIVQESLSNIQRHSGSRTATIRLLQDAENIVLEVQDQGCGLPFVVNEDTPPPVNRLGLGIAGMRERLRYMGGRLSVFSDKQGTIVRATLPRRKMES